MFLCHWNKEKIKCNWSCHSVYNSTKPLIMMWCWQWHDGDNDMMLTMMWPFTLIPAFYSLISVARLFIWRENKDGMRLSPCIHKTCIKPLTMTWCWQWYGSNNDMMLTLIWCWQWHDADKDVILTLTWCCLRLLIYECSWIK